MEDHTDAPLTQRDGQVDAGDRRLIYSPRGPPVQNYRPDIRIARRHCLHAHQVARLQDLVAVHLQGGAEGGADFWRVVNEENGFAHLLHHLRVLPTVEGGWPLAGLAGTL